MKKGIDRIGKPSDGPTYYLSKYKQTERPKDCRVCGQNSYYRHEYHGQLCASHLLDLINVNEELWSWSDYPEVWARTEFLLKRVSPSLPTVSAADVIKNVLKHTPLDGLTDE